MKSFSWIKALCLLGLFLSAAPLGAQTRQETSLYTQTLRKPTVKNAEKFLKKYPSSVYAPKIVRLRDSLVFFALDPEDAAGVLAFRENYPDSYFSPQALERIHIHNTSTLTKEQAREAVGECLDAVGWKKDNVEHILALGPGLYLRILAPDGTQESVRDIPVYSLQDAPGAFSLAMPLEITSPFGGRNYLHFAYLNGDSEYVELLYMPEEDIVQQALFYGNPLPKKEGEPYRIEGQCPEKMEGLQLSAEVGWICSRFAENGSLVQISKADLLTDNAIRWWLEHNPKADTSASRLSFGVLDPESSVVAEFRKARKEKGRGYSAAFFNIRGYTVICSQSRSSGEYSLVWCEPVCKNPKRDKKLNSIYFEGDVLNLFYYKGNSTFKLRISLASKTLRR